MQLKIKIPFWIIFISTVLNSFAQTTQTPRGTDFGNGDIRPDLSSWYGTQWGVSGTYTVAQWNTYYDEYYVFEKERIERCNTAYNCHAYAWADARQSDATSWIWLGVPANCWTDGSYNEVDLEYATHVYYPQDHSLLLTGGTFNGGPEVISKWGRGPLYRHRLFEDTYGGDSQTAKYYRRAVDVPEEFANINDALNAAVPSQTVYISGNQTITNNPTIPTGVILELKIGATLNFQSGSSLTVNGTLICRNNLTVASGAVLYIGSGATVNFASGTQLIVHGRIVANDATFEPISGSWNGILVDGSPASSFDDCSITGIGNSACGITFGDSYSGSHQVSDSYIEGGTAAIWIKNSSDPVISNSYLKGTGSNSVVLSSNNSNGKINDCKLYASNYQVIRGHYNMNTATPCYGDAWKYNIIDGTNFTTNGSSIYVSGGIPYFNYGYNSILPDDYLYQYSNYSGSTREARYNYWGGRTPVVQGYTVEDPNYLANPHANVGPNWTLSKSNTIDDMNFEDTPLAEAWNNYFDHNFTEAKEIAKEQFENNSKEEISTELLFLWMKAAMREGTLEKEESNLQSINKNSTINVTARYEAVRWLSKLAIREGDFETAEKFIASVPSTSLMGREIIFDSADEIMENWGDLDKASALLDVVTTKYRDDETERQKEFVLNLYNSKKDSYKGSNKKETSEEETTLSSFVLNPAYPNPFNPTTTISYQIPEQGFVTLKVYDMLGREVASLVNNKMEAGKYSVNFNASNLASGIYIYNINVQSFEGSKSLYSKTEKMMLLK